MAYKEYAAGKRHTPTEIREGLASMGLRKCSCGRQATRLHRKGKTITVRCSTCEQDAEVNRTFEDLKRWRAGRSR